MRGITWAAVVTRLAIVAVMLAAVAGSPARAAEPTWTGGIDLYRSDAFTTQKSWLWCTAASVQIIGNIVRLEADHSRASQSRYFDYMRANDQYRIPVKDGTDPAGWTLVSEAVNTGNGRTRLLRRFAASEPASYTWTFAGANNVAGAIAAYSGVDPTTPEDVAAVTQIGTTTTPTTASPTAPCWRASSRTTRPLAPASSWRPRLWRSETARAKSKPAISMATATSIS